MTALIWLLLGGVVLTLGDIVFKFWVEKPQLPLYIGGLGIYLVDLMFLVQSFKTENIAVATTIFVIANIIILALVSWLYFNEKLSLLQMAGIALAICAVFLLELGK